MNLVEQTLFCDNLVKQFHSARKKGTSLGIHLGIALLVIVIVSNFDHVFKLKITTSTYLV